MMWRGSNMMGGCFGVGIEWIGMILGIIFFIAIIVGIILFIVWIVKRITHTSIEPKSDMKALEVLKEKYAKGKINKEQYEDIKKDLLG